MRRVIYRTAKQYNDLSDSIFHSQSDVVRWRVNSQTSANKYVDRDDVKLNNAGEYAYIKGLADTFLANPLSELYDAFPSFAGTAITPSGSYTLAESGDNAKGFLFSAFVYACTKNLNYGIASKHFLLTQIQLANFDFGDTVRWADDTISDQRPSFYLASLWIRILRAYDYCYELFNFQEKQIMDEHIFKASVYFKDRNVNTDIEKYYSNRYTESWTHIEATGSEIYTHYNGNITITRNRLHNNRRSVCAVFFGLAGLFFKHRGYYITPTNVGLSTSNEVSDKIGEFVSECELFVKEALIFGTFPDNLNAEVYRGINDIADDADRDDSERGFTYPCNQLHSLTTFAVCSKRASDLGVSGLTNLLNYTTSLGYTNGVDSVGYTVGGTKSLLNSWLELAKLYKGERLIYATTNPIYNNNVGYLINGRETVGTAEYLLHIAWCAEANEISWNNAVLRDLYLGNVVGSLYPTLVNTGSEGSNRPQAGAHGFAECNLFKWVR